MSRTLSATMTAATALDDTRPVYLIDMAWDTASPLPTYLKVCTYDTDIPWNGSTWTASGASVRSLDIRGGRLHLPNGENDPWLNLVQTEKPLDRAISVYEYQTDFSASPAVSDAQLIFTGVMDDAAISDRGIDVGLVESRQRKSFPPTSIGPDNGYNYLLPIGTRIYWGPDIVTIN